MKNAIWKFPLQMGQSPETILCPEGAIIRLVDFQMSAGTICLWMEVDENAPKVTRTFMIVGTGWELPSDREYIGSVQIPPFVWHVYENRRAP